MKLIYPFLLLFMFLILPIQASDSLQHVYLSDIKKGEIVLKNNVPYDNLSGAYQLNAEKDDSFQDLIFNQKSLYDNQKTSFKKELAFDDLSVGIKSDNTILPNQVNSVKTIFSKYNLNDKFSIQTSYMGSTTSMAHNRGKGTFGVTPEYRLNRYFALKTNYYNNFLDKTHKNEVFLNVKPFKDDSLDFNIGAGHTKPTNGTKPTSQLRFSTSYKF